MREICQLIPFYERCILFKFTRFKKRILLLEHENYGTMYQKFLQILKNVKIIILNNKR